VFKSSISAWYSNNFGTTVTVTLTQLDENDDLIEESGLDWYKSIYNITLDKYIDGKSLSSMMIMKLGAAGNIYYNMPDDVQLSDAPLGGKFQVECVNADGYSSNSWEFDYNIGSWHLQHWLQMSCHGLRDKVEVWEDSSFAYPENGRAFRLRYYGKRDVGQAEIKTADVTPLTGDRLHFYSNTSHPFNSNIFYEPIPFDFLRVYDETPQIEVFVNETEAVCHNLNCGFEYVEPVGEVTSFTYDDDTRHLIIEGIDLPQNDENIRYIEFAKSRCELDEEAFSSYTGTVELDSTRSAEGEMEEHEASEGFEVWSIGDFAELDDVSAPVTDQIITSVELCKYDDDTAFPTMKTVYESDVYGTTESGYTPDLTSELLGTTEDDWNNAEPTCESVSVNADECIRGIEVFTFDDGKLSGFKLTTSDDSELTVGTTDDSVTSSGSAFFGDNGCLSGIEPFTDGDADLDSFVFYSFEEIIIEETGEVNTISCTLEKLATCGLHVPYITTNMGLLPNNADMEDYRIDCTITDVWPHTELNLLAIDNLTLSGTLFPWDLSNSEVEMTFTDGDETTCMP